MEPDNFQLRCYGRGVSDPKCVMEKKIYQSDVDEVHHRLLPKKVLDKPVFEGMMTAAERVQMREKGGLKLKVLDQLGREYNVVLFGRDYFKLVSNNGFKVGHYLHIWAYRVGRRRESTADGGGGGGGVDSSEFDGHGVKLYRVVYVT